MPNSPAGPKERERVDTGTQERRRICDFCSEKPALLYCRADAAKLCLACDREVHSTNPLFRKHTRWLLCDGCDSSPSLIHCSTHQLVLCQNCDHDVHTSTSTAPARNLCSDSSSVHDRRPLEGFSGHPSVNEIASFVGIEDFNYKSLGLGLGLGLGFGDTEDRKGGDVWSGAGIWEDETVVGAADGGGGGDGLASNFWVWDAPQGVVSIDDLIVSSDEKHGFQAVVGLGDLPKDRNSSCGLHKQEIISQLCDLGKAEFGINFSLEPLDGRATNIDNSHAVPDFYEAGRNDVKPIGVMGNEIELYLTLDKDDDVPNGSFISQALLGTEEGALRSDRDSDIGSTESHASRSGPPACTPKLTDATPVSSKIRTPEFSNVNRDSALSRYKEKKRSRRYEKHIRYESRKALAQGRTRIKGRFAKIDNSAAPP